MQPSVRAAAPPAAPAAAHPSLRGIALMVVGSLMISVNDAIIKWLSASYPTGELMFLRGGFMFLPILLLLWREGGLRAARVGRWPGQMARAAAVVGSTVFFIAGLRHLPLADTTAIAFAGPLFVTALAPLMLAERVGWRRWSAVLFGFAGVLVMLRPTGGGLNWAAMLPLGAALCGAFRDLLTRRLSATESSLSILVVTTATVALAGLLTAPFGWRMPTAGDLALMALSGIVLGAAHYLIIEAFRLAEAALVAPFKYSSLLWAVALGAMVWGHLPDGTMLIGAVIVVLSGLYILHREMRHRGR